MRLFFGLSPDALARDALDRAAAAVRTDRGHMHGKDMYHLTLVVLGQTPADKTQRLLSIADEAFRAPFDLTLAADMGTFRNGSVLWAGVEASEPLMTLRADLRNRLMAEGFPGGEAEFTPHITLGRGLRLTGPTPPVERVTFPVRRITLYESLRIDDRLVYRPVPRTGRG